MKPRPEPRTDDNPEYFPMEKTQPRRPLQRQRTLPSWLLLLLMTTTAVSLIATTGYLLRNTASQTRPLQRVTLVVGGDQRAVETTAYDVAALLHELRLEIEPQDAISAPLTAPLAEGMTVIIDRARDVRLTLDGTPRNLRTPLTQPAAILASEAIEPSETDLIYLDGTLASLDDLQNWPVPVHDITIQQTTTITIIDGDTEQTLNTSAGTVGEALYDADIPLYLTDLIVPESSTPLTENMHITIDRAQPVTIVVDGVNIETRVQDGTVLDALNEAGLALIGLDYTIPAETEPITPEMTIRVLRVTEAIDSTDEPIAYETVLQADPALELDQRRVAQVGQSGVRRINERVRYENGVEVGREPIDTEIVQPAQNEVIGYGTNIVLRTVITPDGTREYWRKLRVYATSYHPAALGGDNITAIGETLRKGIVGANPNIIPYRTDVFVPGYGTGFIADTGGARSSPYWIDLGYSDEDYRGWSQYVDIYLLAPVPANIDYLLPAWRPMRGLPDN